MLHARKRVINAHNDVIKWKHFCVTDHLCGDEFPSQSQWRRALIFSLNCTWINGWANNDEVGDFIRNRAHYDVTVMVYFQAPVVVMVPSQVCQTHLVTGPKVAALTRMGVAQIILGVMLMIFNTIDNATSDEKSFYVGPGYWCGFFVSVTKIYFVSRRTRGFCWQ